MKKIILFIFLLIPFAGLHAATPSVATSTPPIVLPDAPNNAFCLGEKLVFSLNYEFVTAGTATMEVMAGSPVDGRPTIHIQSSARSTGFVDTVFRVRDFNASTIDRESMASLNFHQNLREGDYKVIRNTSFDYKNRRYTYHREKKGKTTERTGAINKPLHDIFSAFFFTRTLQLKPGEQKEVTVFSDEEVYQLKVIVSPKVEKISVPAGKFDCIRIDPAIIGDGIFKARDSKMSIWLTNDERRMPVLIRSKVIVGSFDAQLTQYQPETLTHFDTPGGK